MPDAAPCPLTPRQLIAFELHAEGHPPDAAAEVMGTTYLAYIRLLDRGCAELGVSSVEDAERVLIDAGWMTDGLGLPAAAHAYLRAFDAYLAAPRDRRDQMLVAELTAAALAELIG
jgi:hypothetical protein